MEWKKRGERVVLCRIETSPDDIHGMNAATGFLTARGGMTSHAAVVARQMGKVCVAGCEAVEVIDAQSVLNAERGAYIVNLRDRQAFSSVRVTSVDLDGGKRVLTFDELGGTVASGGIPGTGGKVILTSPQASYQLDIAPVTGKVRVTRAVTGQTLLAHNVRRLDPGDFIWVPERSDVTAWDHFSRLLTTLAQIATVVIAVRSIR